MKNVLGWKNTQNDKDTQNDKNTIKTRFWTKNTHNNEKRF